MKNMMIDIIAWFEVGKFQNFTQNNLYLNSKISIISMLIRLRFIQKSLDFSYNDVKLSDWTRVDTKMYENFQNFVLRISKIPQRGKFICNSNSKILISLIPSNVQILSTHINNNRLSSKLEKQQRRKTNSDALLSQLYRINFCRWR